jgi:regulator of microtubule dynamics protein 3
MSRKCFVSLKTNAMKTTIILCALLRAVITVGQSESELLSRGMQCRATRDYINGLRIFNSLLKMDSANVNYLCQAGFFITKHTYFYSGEKEKAGLYSRAGALAEKALKIDPASAEAYYVHALALGHLSAFSGLGVKLDHAKAIRKDLEMAIRLDNRHAGAFHTLGRWHAAIAGLNYFQRMTVRLVSSGVTDYASFESASKCFARAAALEPFYKMHMVALAETYYHLGLNSLAKAWVLKAKSMDTRCIDDSVANVACGSLLQKIE